MSRTAITVTPITRAGVAPPSEATGDVAQGNTVPNDGNTFLLVRNSNGASTARVLTIRLSGGADGQSIVPRTVSIPAAASRYIGPFDTASYGTDLLLDPDHAELKIIAMNM